MRFGNPVIKFRFPLHYKIISDLFSNVLDVPFQIDVIFPLLVLTAMVVKYPSNILKPWDDNEMIGSIPFNTVTIILVKIWISRCRKGSRMKFILHHINISIYWTFWLRVYFGSIWSSFFSKIVFGNYKCKLLKI